LQYLVDDIRVFFKPFPIVEFPKFIGLWVEGVKASPLTPNY